MTTREVRISKNSTKSNPCAHWTFSLLMARAYNLALAAGIPKILGSRRAARTSKAGPRFLEMISTSYSVTFSIKFTQCRFATPPWIFQVVVSLLFNSHFDAKKTQWCNKLTTRCNSTLDVFCTTCHPSGGVFPYCSIQCRLGLGADTVHDRVSLLCTDLPCNIMIVFCNSWTWDKDQRHWLEFLGHTMFWWGQATSCSIGVWFLLKQNSNNHLGCMTSFWTAHKASGCSTSCCGPHRRPSHIHHPTSVCPETSSGCYPAQMLLWELSGNPHWFHSSRPAQPSARSGQVFFWNVEPRICAPQLANSALPQD